MTDPDRNQMNGDEDAVPPDDTLARLAAVNPVDPSDFAEPDRLQAQALFEEITMETTLETTLPVWRRPALVAAVAAAAVAVIAGIFVVGFGSSGEPLPLATDSPTGSPTDGVAPPVSAMCVETYSLDTLVNRDFAFDGTLTSVDGDNMTFEVHEVFAGDIGNAVTLGGATTVVGSDTTISVESAGLQVGDRALVSGSDNFAWACGFTMTWDQATADSWRTALQ